MKRSAKRMYVTIFAILLQISWIFLIIYSISNQYKIINLIMTTISVFAVIFVINSNHNPTVKIAWIIILLLMPLFGGVIYWISGGKHAHKKAKNKYKDAKETTLNRLDEEDREFTVENIEDESVKGQVNYLKSQGFYPYRYKNIKYFSMAEYAFEAMLTKLKEAEKYIFMEYYILDEGKMLNQIIDILKEKAANGVEVRIMYDDFACAKTLDKRFDDHMRKAGIKVMPFNTFLPVVSAMVNFRSHRKGTIIDGKVAFTGGYNLADEYINETHPYGTWKDVGIMVEGPAVCTMAAQFLTMWNFSEVTDKSIDKYIKYTPDYDEKYVENSFIVPFSSSPLLGDIVAEKAILNLICQAERYVYITTPYLVMDHEIQTALIMAKERGVDVKIILPGISDGWLINLATKSNYQELLESNVGIYEFEEGFVHGKMFMADDKIGIIGTINLDYRSLYHNHENGCYIYNKDTVTQMRMDFTEFLSKCRKIESRHYKKNHPLSLAYAVLKTFSPLL